MDYNKRSASTWWLPSSHKYEVYAKNDRTRSYFTMFCNTIPLVPCLFIWFTIYFSLNGWSWWKDNWFWSPHYPLHTDKHSSCTITFVIERFFFATHDDNIYVAHYIIFHNVDSSEILHDRPNNPNTRMMWKIIIIYIYWMWLYTPHH